MDVDIASDGDVLVDNGPVNLGAATDEDAVLVLVVADDARPAVIVGADDDAVGDFATSLNDGAHPDDGAPDGCAGDDAAVREQGLFDDGVVDLARREQSGPGVDGVVWVEEVELRHDLRALEVGLVVGGDGPDVLPVVVEDVAVDVPLLDDVGNDVLAEIRIVVVQG